MGDQARQAASGENQHLPSGYITAPGNLSVTVLSGLWDFCKAVSSLSEAYSCYAQGKKVSDTNSELHGCLHRCDKF
jgi:hypothetical protein